MRLGFVRLDGQTIFEYAYLVLSALLRTPFKYFTRIVITVLVRRTSAPMPFYGGDYRPDDEPPPEAVLEEKRIVEHQFRRPSPSRWSSSTASSIRPSSTTRQGANRSLRARGSSSSPRRSLQRSSAFSNRRSKTINDRERTASMPAVPIIKVRSFCVLFLTATRPSYGTVQGVRVGIINPTSAPQRYTKSPIFTKTFSTS